GRFDVRNCYRRRHVNEPITNKVLPEAKLSIKLENAQHKESILDLKLLLLEIVQAQFSNAKVS
ncbi:MAG: hypothetical protein ACR2PY_08505, partial [Salinispira sp.]